MKTNQFNLTTRRISDDAFRALIGNSAYMVVGLRVSDRFGDSGITGLAIIDRGRQDVWTVQDFLLSCRVLGRTVENAFLSWLVARAAGAGANRVAVHFAPSARNEVAHGFLKVSGGMESDSGDVWTFDVRRPEAIPEHYVQIDESQVS
jgi:FkbH-like protein